MRRASAACRNTHASCVARRAHGWSLTASCFGAAASHTGEEKSKGARIEVYSVLAGEVHGGGRCLNNDAAFLFSSISQRSDLKLFCRKRYSRAEIAVHRKKPSSFQQANCCQNCYSSLSSQVICSNLK
ncbi:hypothetical protein GUJ93_ZPchr0009g1400 [Zizania palustris]|uniref:Uncharacterized protein n=1 Tax=Zizania palustris TaxID=103762 RepID=A0A8J5RQN8_ZIZPA|nr:hypothetical protein GUJ93_ZPchr0009g1400 [Zizania palustris]